MSHESSRNESTCSVLTYQMDRSNRRKVREIVEGYLKQKPDATLEDFGCLLGVSRQRASNLLAMAGVKTQRARSTHLQQGSAKLLTDRELQILSYISKGSSNKQIAGELGTSWRTVKNQVAVIIAKLDANNRQHAAVLARTQGLLPR